MTLTGSLAGQGNGSKTRCLQRRFVVHREHGSGCLNNAAMSTTAAGHTHCLSDRCFVASRVEVRFTGGLKKNSCGGFTYGLNCVISGKFIDCWHWLKRAAAL